MEGILRIDVHYKKTREAISEITNLIDRANRSVYLIKVIHGFNRGTRIREAITEEYSYGREERVLRIEMGENEGITNLILRELF